MPNPPPISAAELDVLKVLWDLGPASVRDVHASLNDESAEPLAYNTVQTILTRLHDKQIIRRRPAGRAYAYSPVLDESDLAALRMRSVLDRGGDRTTVLTRFVGTLTPEEESTLAAILREQETG